MVADIGWLLRWLLVGSSVWLVGIWHPGVVVHTRLEMWHLGVLVHTARIAVFPSVEWLHLEVDVVFGLLSSVRVGVGLDNLNLWFASLPCIPVPVDRHVMFVPTAAFDLCVVAPLVSVFLR